MSVSDKKIKQSQRIEVALKFPLVIVGALLVLAVLVYILLVKSYVITVEPDDARPVKYTLKSGVGVFINNTLYTASSSNVIGVEAAKFKPAEQVIDGTSPTSMTITLEPLPALVTLTTAPQVSGLKWYLDGELVSVSATLEHELPPGDYTIDAISPYYLPAQTQVSVQAGDEVSEELMLAAVDGQLIVLSEPIGANVSVAGEGEQVTPAVFDLSGGQHSVSVTLEGYEPLDDMIEVTVDDHHPTRNYRLTPLQAQLNVTLQPTGGILLIDGKPAVAPVSVDADKLHMVSYSKAGYLPFEAQQTLAPGEVITLDIALEPEMAAVNLTANLPAQVQVNGKAVGQTPIELSLQTLDTTVVFTRPGYRSVEQRIQVQANKVNRVEATLLTEFAARRAEGRPLVISQMGIDMVRIDGKAFTMGSAPNVPHRKQHEHPVKVDFTRPFLLSSKEITQAQFARFMSTTPTTNLPMTNVSWEQAILFCNWLSEQEGLTPFYDLSRGTVNKTSLGYRLPTEAEWEFAASAFQQYTSFKYFWGNSDRLTDNQGNYADAALLGSQTFVLKKYQDGFKGPAPVGSFKPRSGLFDMDGNVSEWVNDWYQVSKPDLSQVYFDYTGAENGVGHVVKGGSFKTGRLRELRNAVRIQGTAGADDIGFRIARYVQ